MRSIRELDLSKEAYMLLITNGIKTVEGLTAYTRDELLALRLDNYKYSKYYVPELVKEIVDTLRICKLELGVKPTGEVLTTEKRIEDLDIPSRAKNRLKKEHIVTIGKLSTLKEEKVQCFKGIGIATFQEIKQKLETVNGFIFNRKVEDMITENLSAEDLEYLQIMISRINQKERESQKIHILEEEREDEYRNNREKLYKIEIEKLGIPNPIFPPSISNDRLTLGVLLRVNQNLVNNKTEINLALSKIPVPGLKLGMKHEEIITLPISDNKYKEIEEYIKTVDIIKEEEIIRNKERLGFENRCREELLIEKAKLHNEYLKKEIKSKRENLQLLEKILEENKILEKEVEELNIKLKEAYDLLGISTIDTDETEKQK